MMRITAISVWSVVILVGIFCPALADDDITLTISLDRDKIGQQEYATLSVCVTTIGQRDLPKPELPPLPQFEVYPVGTSSQFNQVNKQIQSSMTYNYALSPRKTGIFPIHSAWLVYDNQRYESNELSLEVVGTAQEAVGSAGQQAIDEQGQHREVFLVIETDKKKAYVDEQVTLITRFFSRSDVRLLSAIDYKPPHTPDFWPIDISPQRQYAQVIDGQEYIVRELRQALFPTKPGQLTIAAAQATVTVPERRRRTRDPFSLFGDLFESGKRVTVESKPVMINVEPLPVEGRPAGFSGAVGDYRLTATVDKTEVETNEGVALVVKVSGTGNTRSIPEPVLPEMDGLRIEKSSSDAKTSTMGATIGGTKTFEYLLIPRFPGQHIIEPLVLTFFDPAQKKYREVKTAPIQLNVRQGQLTAGTDLPYAPVSGQMINLQATDIRYIKTDGQSLRPIGSLPVFSPFYLALVILPTLAVVGGMIDLHRRRRLADNIVAIRGRKAKTLAHKRLKKAAALLSKPGDAYFAEVSAAVHQYLASKLNLSPHGLTSDQLENLLASLGVPETLKRETLAILREADFGRFAGGSGGQESRRELLGRAGEAIAGLEEVL